MIHIDNQTDFRDAALLERAARLALETVAPESAAADLSILLSDDRQLHELNLDYLGVDAPTDVLSFPAGEIDPETQRLYLGDLALSVPRAAQQAQEGGHSVEAEAQLLIVHGVLHLLGYDHDTDEKKSEMWARQAEVLQKLGLARIQIRE
ncbi:MAG: rRNA maturation RNase YbeY [Anaerolineales bacterium]|nr:rRNA maturation RNase YbeY [Anaerolineales bacterium]